jgi:hypothetical protein
MSHESRHDPVTVLRRRAELMPDWLASYRPGMPFPKRAFFASRVVYYPGSRTDGHPLRIFGKAHAAHCFVYADYWYGVEDAAADLTDRSRRAYVTGYQVIGLQHLNQPDLFPPSYVRHPEIPEAHMACHAPFALWAVLERSESLTDEHGPKRIVIVHVVHDAYLVFHALFCQRGRELPYAIVLQDHGFGGNWNPAGFGGEDNLLLRIALERRRKLPRWLFVADLNTKPWPGYIKASDADIGGSHEVPRSLYRLGQRGPAER